MNLESKLSNLLSHFGESKIQIDYLQENQQIELDDPDYLDKITSQFNKVRITHLPTGIVKYGVKFQTQIENAIYALEELREEFKNSEKRKNASLTQEEWITFFLLPFFTSKPRWREDHFSKSELERFEKYGFEKKHNKLKK